MPSLLFFRIHVALGIDSILPHSFYIMMCAAVALVWVWHAPVVGGVEEDDGGVHDVGHYHGEGGTGQQQEGLKIAES
jgi:hypothetical protein